MSDYLSRAAERVNGTSTAVRPFLPSLFDFEKTSADSVITTFKPLEAHQHLEVQPPGSVEEKAIRVPGVQDRVASVLALAPETPAVTQTDKSEPVPRPTSADVPPSRAISESERGVRVSASSTESESRLEKSSLPERSDLRPRATRSTPVAEPSAKAKESPPHSGVTRSDAEVEPSVELSSKQSEPIRPKVIEQVKNNLPRAIPVTAVPGRRESSLRRVQARKPIRSADGESSSERTIQVTIGRLEVRAVQSAPSPPKPAPPKPRISLEEYLRSRNRGAG